MIERPRHYRVMRATGAYRRGRATGAELVGYVSIYHDGTEREARRDARELAIEEYGTEEEIGQLILKQVSDPEDDEVRWSQRPTASS